MIRILNIPRHLFNILRPQYALNYVTYQLNRLYRVLLACLYPLVAPEAKYERACSKYYALAANDGSAASIAAYLNYYYGQYGQIKFGIPPTLYLTVYSYSYPTGGPVEFSTYGGGDAVQIFNASASVQLLASTIYIPQELSNSAEYSDFSADVNALLVMGVKATIKTY